MNRLLLYFFLLIATGAGLAGCSAERNNPFSKFYHNVTARYNGYFLARERMKAVEQEIANKMVYDYNQVLPIFPVPDASLSAKIAPDLEEVIKKASFPIQRHKNSKWVDDSYILIGKARYYKEEYEDAVKIFKYVNSTSPDQDARHTALVWLMRTFMKDNENNNAQAVSEFLAKEMLNRDNARELFLTRAQYYTQFNETQKVIDNLERAVPLIDDRDRRSRIRFILGQLYQQTGEDQKAYQHYTKILKKNPPYELGFFTKLNLGQVTELNRKGDIARMQKYYAKLLKDTKNKEYLDKIYFEMARFERKQQKFDKALEHVQSSVQAAQQNPTQRGYSYLLAGQIYFDNLQKYQLAQAYYDSAVQTLPTTIPGYQAISDRRDVLTDFAKQLYTIQLQDSVQALAQLDSAALDKKFDEILAQEQARREAELERQRLLAEQQKRAGQQQQTDNFLDSPTAGGTWYFDNPSTLATAQQEFIRKWGDRPLQDNWRQSSLIDITISDQPVAQETGTGTNEPEEKQDNTLAAKATMRAGIPRTPEQLEKSHEQIEDALFALANIYNYKLNEPKSAAQTYEELLKRYPTSNYAAEAYYSLYLIYNKLNDDKQLEYANKIRQEYPSSTYAKLLENPQYMSSTSVENVKARELYDSAFTFYEKEKYKEAQTVLASLTTKYPQTDINDKIAFLKVLLIARTQPAADFKLALQNFMETYPSSSLIERANQLMDTFRQYESGELFQDKTAVNTAKATPAKVPTNYTVNKNGQHFFVIAYPRNSEAFNNFLNSLSDYNQQFFQQDKLELSPFLFGDKMELAVVKGFKDAKSAMHYADKQKAPNAPLSKITGVDYNSFIISTDNFPAFYKAKDIEEYLTFYRKNYF
ncbi:MAG: tetratricopeptide repeat protein [Hymenobacteraceae bacterium]|nr:tetratricopeptide repeat protein [Hymenobacteraceae bacterium]MDX5395486.1 tetratricopeptide repeat protein [Hymenobacteraceae bacterium]MDX5511538.1 tetratricopeptide repeat protein [Hymenobacteraceae bacterium]